MSESYSYVGFCSSCGTGPLGILVCGHCDRFIVLCEECDAIWTTPDRQGQAIFQEQPDLPCPHCHHSLRSSESHWASTDEIAVQDSWRDHVVGLGRPNSETGRAKDVAADDRETTSVDLPAEPTSFCVVPRQGVAPIQFGMSRREVRVAMPGGVEPIGDKVDSFFASCFQVHYDKNDVVEFIELSTGAAEMRVLLDGIDIFRTPADDVVEAISAEATLDPKDSLVGRSYQFPELDVCVGRSADWHRFFQTIGVGKHGYFAS